MKLKYSTEDVERWRDKTHRRTPQSAVTNERQALAYVKSVGFCLASKVNGLELPNLWEAVRGGQPERKVANGERSYYLSYAWEMQAILPNHGSVYYGKVFKRRPSIISREYLPYFYALIERTGARDEYKKEFAAGRLSATAKSVMDKLIKSSSLSSKELREVLCARGANTPHAIEKALDELQRKMFICRLSGNGHQFGAVWALVARSFAPEVRKATKISPDLARRTLLEKYFRNQLLSSVEEIHHVFGWTKKIIYQTLGQLIGSGIITTTASLDGKRGKYYCLVH